MMILTKYTMVVVCATSPIAGNFRLPPNILNFQ